MASSATTRPKSLSNGVVVRKAVDIPADLHKSRRVSWFMGHTLPVLDIGFGAEEANAVPI